MIFSPPIHKPESVMPVREIGEAYGIVSMPSQVAHKHLILRQRAAVSPGSDVEFGASAMI